MELWQNMGIVIIGDIRPEAPAMIGTLIGILLVIIVLGVIWWAIQQLIPLIPLGEPFHTIVRVILVVILVLIVVWIITVLLGAAGVHVNTFNIR